MVSYKKNQMLTKNKYDEHENEYQKLNWFWNKIFIMKLEEI